MGRPGSARDHRRIAGNVVGTVVSMAAGAFHVDAMDLLHWNAQHFCDRLPVRIDALRMRPYGCSRIVIFDHGTRRPT